MQNVLREKLLEKQAGAKTEALKAGARRAWDAVKSRTSGASKKAKDWFLGRTQAMKDVPEDFKFRLKPGQERPIGTVQENKLRLKQWQDRKRNIRIGSTAGGALAAGGGLAALVRSGKKRRGSK